ncbi:MAG: H-X9-DG-CTERM domain-containing protein, partial [Victivallales bacterium]
ANMGGRSATLGGLAGYMDRPDYQQVNGMYPYHNKKFNYLFCDEHVELMSPYRTFGTGTLNNPKGIWTRAKGD